MHRVLIAAAALVAVLLGFNSAQAQLAPDPATYSGCGLLPGDVVAASYHDEDPDCATTIVDETGSWHIVITDDSPCRPTPGGSLEFLVNNAYANESFVYAYGHRVDGIVFSGLRLRPRIVGRVCDGVVTPADKSDASMADDLLEQWPLIMLTLAALALIVIAAAEVTMVLRARRD